MSRNGIEPCLKAEREGTECMCGLLPEVLLNVEAEDGIQPELRCRLCTGVSTHYFYRLLRFGRPWGIEVCGVCGTVCNEY
ncbi:MAG: hypothetical protein WCS37_12250 [Chloroflexota bacterium]|nr:hypothetical protein [Chloroflexota bacterium]